MSTNAGVTPNPVDHLNLQKVVSVIVDDLMTNGNGDKAERLVLWRDSDKRDLGGWSFLPLVDRIVDRLRSLLAQQTTVETIHETRSPDGDGHDPQSTDSPNVLPAALGEWKSDGESVAQQGYAGAGSEPAGSHPSLLAQQPTPMTPEQCQRLADETGVQLTALDGTVYRPSAVLASGSPPSAGVTPRVLEHINRAYDTTLGIIEVARTEDPEMAFSRVMLQRARSVRDELEAVRESVASVPAASPIDFAERLVMAWDIDDFEQFQNALHEIRGRKPLPAAAEEPKP